MKSHLSFVLTRSQYKQLFQHLHLGDDLESAAIILCHTVKGIENSERLIARSLTMIPADECRVRTSRELEWPFEKYFPPEKISEIDESHLSIVTIHSHPKGYSQFSKIDDDNDRALFHSIRGWFNDNRPHGSAIMLPSGEIVARLLDADGKFRHVHMVSVISEDLQFWNQCGRTDATTDAGLRVWQTFGKGTYGLLRNLRVCVVGCSGTGSIIAELLARNCVGNLILIDPDLVEHKNLNRIVSAKNSDADKAIPKVDVLGGMISRMGTGVTVEAIKAHTWNKSAIEHLVVCDVIFGCVDSAEGRYHLECIASSCRIPYFDLGVNLQTDFNGAIQDADAVVHYMHPGNSSLLSRGGYTSCQVTAESWKRSDRKYYDEQRIAGYLAEVGEDQPAVMSINMQAACMAFNDFMARLHKFRLDPNSEFDIQRFRLVHGHYMCEQASISTKSIFDQYSGTGDRSQLLQKLREQCKLDSQPA